MLARVAENMYWMARYLERAEDLARLIDVTTHLHLDLPRGSTPSWGTLLTLIGAEESYREKHGVEEDEGRVLRFLLGDKDHPQSLRAAIAAARSNARGFREVFPREAWEDINGLYHFSQEQLKSGLSKRGRHTYLRGIITRVQTVVGRLEGAMNRDEAYYFIELGRQLERADMTTRLIDSSSARLVPREGSDGARFDDLQWMSVLKSLTGYQMYRLEMQRAIRSDSVLAFLFQSSRFPRSVAGALLALRRSLEALDPEASLPRRLPQVLRQVSQLEPEGLAGEKLHALIDELQQGFADIHGQLERRYFRPSRSADPETGS
jgi:uncharacterized alpha-E superfamily protein